MTEAAGLIEQVRQAWIAWDRYPGQIDTAVRMQEACEQLAVHLGVGHVQLRRSLAQSRREDLTYDQALERVHAQEPGPDAPATVGEAPTI